MAGLQAVLERGELDPGEMVRRTHEITEQTLQQTLTGIDDFGSGASIPAVAGQLQATRELLADLRPLLAPRYSGLTATDTALATTQAAVAVMPSWSSADRVHRERLAADLSGLCELLAPVATVLEPRALR